VSRVAGRCRVRRRSVWPVAAGAERGRADHTDPRAFRPPSEIDDAFGFCEDLIRQPHSEIVEPGDRHCDIFKRLCIGTNTRGSRVTDAWFAALAIEWGCEWITFDRDYARFPGLNWSRPTSPGWSFIPVGLLPAALR